MPLDQLPQFMQAIAEQESGGRYDALGPQTTTYGRAQGKYQIMEKIWPAWAREAGLPGADPWDPQAQEKVARHKMRQYYNRFGSWDLVAVAWFAGPGRAEKAARNGIQSIGGLADVTGTDVAEYVQTMNSNMGGPSPSGVGGRRPGLQPGSGRMGEPADAEDVAAAQAARDPSQRFVEGRRQSTETMAGIFSTVADLSSRRDRIVDINEMFGFDDQDDEPIVEVG